MLPRRLLRPSVLTVLVIELISRETICLKAAFLADRLSTDAEFLVTAITTQVSARKTVEFGLIGPRLI